MPVWYDMDRHRQSDVGFPTLYRVGGDSMTVFEALSLMIAFATLVVARRWLMSFNIKKLYSPVPTDMPLTRLCASQAPSKSVRWRSFVHSIRSNSVK